MIPSDPYNSDSSLNVTYMVASGKMVRGNRTTPATAALSETPESIAVIQPTADLSIEEQQLEDINARIRLLEQLQQQKEKERELRLALGLDTNSISTPARPRRDSSSSSDQGRDLRTRNIDTFQCSWGSRQRRPRAYAEPSRLRYLPRRPRETATANE